jgi:hypothetical protein
MDIVMTFIENHHGVQWKLCTQEHQLSVSMSHAIYMTMLHEVIMPIFSHKACYMLHEKLQNLSNKFQCYKLHVRK